MTAAAAANPLAGLPARFARAERRKKWLAFAPVAPLLAFLLVAFIAPVLHMTKRSADGSIVPRNLPLTAAELSQWDGQSAPADSIYAAMLADLRQGARDKTATRVGQRLNYEVSGFSGLFRKSARRVAKLDDAVFADPAAARAALLEIDKKWGRIETWRVIKKFSAPLTPYYYYAAFDFRYDAEADSHKLQPSDRAIYGRLFARTLALSLLITLCALLLGYPTAFLLATLPNRIANVLLILVLLPFWTSLLVRTTSWIVLLQQQGVLNDILVAYGIVDDERRLKMIHNAFGAVVAMTHILLPFMILPLYSVMKSIPPGYVRAARSMGAGAIVSFRRIYLPQTLPGVSAGAILVFILAIGYYITPELVGGTSGSFISNRIAYHISSSLNWGLAAALGFLLLVIVLALYLIYDRVIGADKLKLG